MLDRNPYIAEVVKLREQRDDARAELQDLKKQLVSIIPLPREWKLEAAERRAVCSMAAAPDGFRSREILHTVMSKNGTAVSPNLVSVRIHRMRQKLKPFGVTIETVHGDGYRMPKASRRVIAKAIAANR